MATSYISFIYLFSAAMTILTVCYGNITLPTVNTYGDDQDVQKFLNILEALVFSGEKEIWGDILNKVDISSTSVIPISVTLFIPHGRYDLPQDHVTLDSSIYYYHIVPQRLTFSDLSLFPIGSRIPTLLPNNSIVVTNNSISNFCINGVLLNRPDLFSAQFVAVHGVSGILNYSVNGNADAQQITSHATRLKNHDPPRPS